MNKGFQTTLGIGVSALALALAAPMGAAQDVLSRAQVVGGADACPAIFVSFSTPLSLTSSSQIDGGRGLRIQLANAAGVTGADLIETFPALTIANIGQVGLTLDTSGANPVLTLRFDQAVNAGVDVVQAGDSSIVVTGISADADVVCGAAASAQDPLADTTADAGGATPPAVDPNDPAQAEIEALFAEARSEIAAQNYPRAVQLLTKLTQMPLHSRSADAQELLGVVRERNGQLAQAQAEYETYLATFPDSPGASRVRQRLAALLTAVSAPPELRDAGPGFTGPTDAPVAVAGVPRGGRGGGGGGGGANATFPE